MSLPIEDRLAAHLSVWLGAWPAGNGELLVTTSKVRTQPGWDGVVHPVGGVAGPQGAVLSVPPSLVESVAGLATSLDELRQADLSPVFGPGSRLFEGVFRWSESPAPLPDAGVWVPTEDPSVPDWLLPFGGEVLMARNASGGYVAGVGVKRHDDFGHELAVVTEAAAQGKGLARRLVAQAARRVLDGGQVPTYLHADRNVASAKVAEAAGFPDLGWRVLGVVGATALQRAS